MKKVEPTGPDAEIKLATHMFFLLFILLFVSFGIWAFFSTLDIMSITTGEVVPSGNIKEIQHLEGGIVKNILVKEGQVVKKDQPLIELENTASKATVEELKIRTASLSINIVRLNAELAGADHIEFDKNIAKGHKAQIEQAKELFFANREQLKNHQESQRKLVSQRSQSLNELKIRLRNQEKRISLLNEQVKISESLLEDDLTNRYDHLNLLKESNLLHSSIEENRIGIKRADSALKEQESRLASILSAYKQDVQIKLEENRQNFSELSQRIRKFKDSLQRTVLRAPVDGIIKTLYVFTQGGVVRAGSTILDIVPQDDYLIIEAKLQTQDIGYISPGQNAVLTLTSADAFKYGVLNGKVIQISPDTFITPQGMAYYKASIMTDKSYFESGKEKYMLYPGMILQVSIQTGKRTVLQYILSPFLNSMNSAMTER